MVRSLYCGISGLRNQQVSMDVTGNNIANVNTVGFKSSRVTFEESLAQLLKGASRPPGNAGGTNPMQIGLGMSIGSVDTLLSQGNLQSTGQITDLALEGRAYFVFSSGEGNYYSRNGGLQLDSNGRLVSPTNGFTLQGVMAAADGSYPAGSSVGNIRIPYGEKAPAVATTEVAYSSNLDSDSEGLGTVVHSNRFLSEPINRTTSAADTTILLTNLFDENGNSLGIQEGDVLTVSAADSGGTTYTQDLSVTSTTTISDLLSAIDSVIVNVDGTFIAGTTSLQTDGSVRIGAAGGNTIYNLQVTSDRPGSNSYVTNLLSWGPTVPGVNEDSVGQLRRPALSADPLSDVFDASGQTLGLEYTSPTDYDVITVNGAVGGDTVTAQTLDYSTTVTLGDLIDTIQTAFNLPDTDGTTQNNNSVGLNAGSSDDGIPDGSIVIRGQPETAFALSSIAVTASNNDNDATAPTRFNANMTTTEVQSARDTAQHSTSIVVYDESGDAHTMTTTFTHSGTPGEWLWDITMEGGEEILGGNRGRITFGQDGSPSAFTFNGTDTTLRFDPMNGSNEVSINLDVGSPGSFQGITQFRSQSTTAARYQDGYPMGKLQEVSIDEFGEISGIYTNGVSKSLARIYVAEFNNPAGLLKRGDSMYSKSNNTGEAVMLRPGVGSSTKIKPGALEMSNVELATEFTNMITTQRGYQASARVITTSDSLLQELVQLVR